MGATLVVRHKVEDYPAWRAVYDELETLRSQHGCTAHRVLRLPEDANDLLITHDFPSLDQAVSYAESGDLKAGMARAGVAGPPRVEIFAAV